MFQASHDQEREVPQAFEGRTLLGTQSVQLPLLGRREASHEQESGPRSIKEAVHPPI